MQQLLGALAQAEKQQPYLAKQKVKRGTRCLAQCVLGADSRAWNRSGNGCSAGQATLCPWGQGAPTPRTPLLLPCWAHALTAFIGAGCWIRWRTWPWFFLWTLAAQPPSQ